MSWRIKMKSDEIRKLFLDYFKKNGHTIVPSSPLVPANDPTLLFTNAGMVQFKDVFLGKEVRQYKKAVTIQRCLRAGGKHNDLDNVGYTTRHHTFFEMLGNFSFGDYFKRDAIKYAWDFLVNGLKIPPEKLWITVHEDDQEAAEIWLNDIKIDPKKFSYMGDKDNFWAMGETGPCGYCSEIFYDHGESVNGVPPGREGEEGERYVEIWNLVFMQFERNEKGELILLPKPSVDTGMGLERITAVMQGVHDNYETDLFTRIIGVDGKNGNNDIVINKLWGISKEKVEENKISFKVIGDHIRAIAFLIADNVIPSNEGRDYVLRRIIRRAIYHLKIKLNPPSPDNVSLVHLVPALIGVMGDAYPELKKSQEKIEKIIAHEEKIFSVTLANGLKIFEQTVSQLGKCDGHINGDVAFYLYDTYGLPIDLIQDLSKERNLTLDMEGFEEEKGKQRERSRSMSKFGACSDLKLPISGATEFVGYDEILCQDLPCKIVAMFTEDGTKVDSLTTFDKGIIVLDQTPFYAESGGQVGDTGWISTGELDFRNLFSFTVLDTKKYGSLHLHYGVIEHGPLQTNTHVKARVDTARRNAIKLNHSSAHLLHKALQIVLGEHAVQRGSLVDDKKLRFDFTHFESLTPNEKREIKRIVKEKINDNLVVETEIKSLDMAKKDGALALFGEKYGDLVRVVKMGDFSKELCGGTHVKHTLEIGDFEIVSETAIAAGVRRIEAITGDNALRWLRVVSEEESKFLEQSLEKNAVLRNELINLTASFNKSRSFSCENEVKKAFDDESDKNLLLTKEVSELKSELIRIKIKSTNDESVRKDFIESVVEDGRLLEREISNVKNILAVSNNRDLADRFVLVGEIKVVVAKIDDVDNKALRQILDSVKQKLDKSVVVLATVNGVNKIQLIVGVSKELGPKLDAGKILEYLNKQIGGKGGGRQDMAQGGGEKVEALDFALNSVFNLVKAIVEGAL